MMSAFMSSHHQIRESIKIIINGYPSDLQFNVETNLLWGKFLNIRIFNNPTSPHPFTTVLRKENFKYDIIPFNSNVPQHFKLMAGRSYFRTARSHTNSKIELKNQLKIVHAILKNKGFPNSMIKRMQSVKNTKLKPILAKTFLGKTVFDKVSLRHSFVTKVFLDSSLNRELLFLPMSVPGPKIEQFLFTIRKMRAILKF